MRSVRDGIQSNDTRVEELSVIRILRELHEKSRKENDGKVHVREIKDGDIGRTIEKF